MKLYSAVILILVAAIQALSAQMLTERGISPDGAIFDMELKEDILYVGGHFDMAGYLTGGIALFEEEDTLPDLDFPYIHGEVYTIIPDGEGGWFAGGDFDQVNQINRGNLVHILPSMEVDPNFNPGINNTVRTLLKKDNVLYIGGLFTMMGGEMRRYFAAWDLTSNTLDPFDPSPDGWVLDMVLYQDELIMGGSFSEIGDSSHSSLARLDINTGTLGGIPGILSGHVNALFLDDNILYAGGTFSGGALSVDLSSGNLTGWHPNVSGFAFSMRVNDICKRDSVIYMAGGFSKVMGINRNNIAAVSESGNLLDFAPEPDAEVFSIFVHGDDLYFGGDFQSIGLEDISHIARYDMEHNLNVSWNLNPDWTIHAFADTEDQLIVGGEFKMIQAVERDNAYAVDTRTGKLTGWNPISDFLVVSDLKVDELRDAVYLAGWDSKTLQNLKAFDGTKGEKLDGWNLVFDNAVHQVDQDRETGNLFVVGSFTELNSQNTSRMAMLDPSGNIQPFSFQADNEIRSVAVSEEHGLVYIIGDFDSVNSEIRHKSAAVEFDGTLAAWDPKPVLRDLPPEYVKVKSLLVRDDRVFIGGTFDSISNAYRPRLAAVDPLTGDILPWNAGVVPESSLSGSVDLIRDFQNGILITGTRITELSGQTFIYMAWLGVNSAQNLNLKEMGYYFVNCLDSNDSTLYLGGDFESLSEKFHPFYAELVFSSQLQNLGEKIERYSPEEGGNAGDVTLEIIGSGFGEGTSILLRKTGMEDIEAATGSTFIHDKVRISATFDLREAPLGLRDIVILIPGDTTIVLENAFNIVEGSGPRPWADMIAPSFITRRVDEYFYLSYGNSGDADAHGVPVWLAFSPNIDVKEIGIDLLRLLDESDPYYDSIPEFVTIDSLFASPYQANVYGYIIPKIPAGSSNMIAIRVRGEENGSFYTRAWVDEPMFGSPLKYWVSECEEAIMMQVLGVVPYAGCVANSIDLLVSPFLDYFWDPNFGTLDYGLSHMELGFSTVLDCVADMIPGVALKSAAELIQEFLNAKSWFDLARACSEQGEDKEDTSGDFVSSMDPNDKTGPRGQGGKGWLNTEWKFAYMVRFENDPEATAPAKLVRITDTLDPGVFDLASLEFMGFTIADSVYSIPSGYSNIETLIDLRPRLPYYVELKASLDAGTGLLTWQFISLDTATMEPVTDPLGGFLPPDIDSISGRGSIFYDVSILPGLSSGTKIKNQAAIFFDTNDPIITNEWHLMADNDIPVSQVLQTVDTVYASELDLHWTGYDEGSGIRYFDLKFRENGGNWYYAAAQETETSMVFQGTPGRTYEFISVAYDSALNRETEPLIPDAKVYFAGEPGSTQNQMAGDMDRIWIGPNPVDRNLHIHVSEAIQSMDITLMDITGRLVFRSLSQSTSDRIILELEDLPAGPYILHINHGTQQEIHKIIKLN